MDFGLIEHRGSLARMIGNAAPPILTIAVIGALIDQGLLGPAPSADAATLDYAASAE